MHNKNVMSSLSNIIGTKYLRYAVLPGLPVVMSISNLQITLRPTHVKGPR